MEFYTLDTWDDTLWPEIDVVYRQAFPRGRKSEQIIKRLMSQKVVHLHAVREADYAIGMALTAALPGVNAELIDYIGVLKGKRSQGVGSNLVEYIQAFAKGRNRRGMVIEVEWDGVEHPASQIHQRRIQFWENCGFELTDYVHDYRVVPELYRAMVLPFETTTDFPIEGRILFQHIGAFHRLAWGGK